MPKKRKITKKERKRNKTLDIISTSMSLLVFLYVVIMEFTNYHVKVSYIPIEVLFIILIISDYIIIKKSVNSLLNTIIIMLNSVIMAYILCIEIILLPLTFKNSNSAYI